MSLATRCPKCQTLFKVTLGQLQVYEGQVRCGQCQLVFSGIDHLTAADTEVWSVVDLDSTNTPSPTAKPIEPQFLTSGGGKGNKQFKAPAFKTASKPVKATLFGMIVVLLLQLTWWQRTSIASQVPALSNWVANSSEQVQWWFSLPADTSLELLGSGMARLSDSRLQVDVTLRNSTNLPSKWPHIRIKLRDSQGTEIASKLLKPSDYVMRSKILAKSSPPIAARQTVEVTGVLNIQELRKQLPGLSPAGFEIQLFSQSVDLL